MTTQTIMNTEKETISRQGERPETVDTLEITDLHAEIDGQEILRGVSLTIHSGEIHVIMGHNGSGKSTLCKVLMGHPNYEITKGEAKFNGEDITEMEPDERANLGIFLGFQHPIEIPGVTLGNFLRLAKNANLKANDPEAKNITPMAFMKELKVSTDLLKMPKEHIGRAVNEGFSGGEKKRAEIAQMATLKPKMALLDEIDSGLDIDALRVVAEGINQTFADNQMGILLITHYQRILNYIKPDYVHIMAKGQIVKSGDHQLAEELEKDGYEKYL